MIKWFNSFSIFVLLLLFGCNKKKQENPYDVAKNYCDCIEKLANNTKDSLIDLQDCDYKFDENSRLMKIKSLYDKEPLITIKKYPLSTIDSAKKFFTDVIRIIDTMCYLKLDFNRLKKRPHYGG